MTWTIQRKLTFGFGLAILMLLACTFFAWRGISSADRTAQQVQDSYAAIGDLEHYVSLVREVSSEQRAYLISGEEQSIAGIPAIRKELDTTGQALDKRLAGTPQAETMNQIKAVVAERRTFVNQMLSARKNESFDAAKTLFSTGKDNVLLARIIELVDQLKSDELQKLNAAQQAQQSTKEQTFAFLFAAGVASIIILLLVSTFLTRSIKRNIEISIQLLDAMSHKNLAVSDGVAASQDELAQSITAINGLKASMHQVIGAMANAATDVAAAGNQISKTSAEIAHSVETERSEVEQIASALHEMTITVQDVASNSHDAAKAAEQAAHSAEQGGQVVLGAVSAMQQIAETVGQAAADITKLGKETEGIGSVVNLIEDIATQTNLLALNATIEAARAGEQGKGFAVVASEVRRLAERTAEFTKEIADKISSVQRDAETAVKSMNHGKDQVDLGVSRASEARESLEQIISAVTAAKERIAMIATATTEQSAATGELSHNVEHISKQVVTTSQGAEQNAEACAELARLAESLHNIVYEFRLSETPKQKSPENPASLHQKSLPSFQTNWATAK